MNLTAEITRADRLEAIHDMPCIACDIENKHQPFRTEAHHLVDNGYRRLSGGDDATIPLDGWHHRGLCLEGFTATEMAEFYGPSLALEKKKFKARYGDERELLAKVNDRLRTA